MKVSYGLTVCNEHIELENLINLLLECPKDVDEIVVVYDQNRVTDEVLNVIDRYKKNIRSYPYNFQDNFLENKNYMNSQCNGDYIFQIDADEIPHKHLIKSIKPILTSNKVDILITPRKNLVKGITNNHIIKWNWKVNPQGWINWPDPQKRIYKNDKEIQWTGHQVHGMVSGYKTYAFLPFIEEYCLIHEKTIEKQEKQNNHYNTL